jgi:hypothetical protein
MVNRSGPAATLSGYPVELLREWLRTSCEAQGVPLAVRDARVVANVAVLLGVWSAPAGAGMCWLVAVAATRCCSDAQPPTSRPRTATRSGGLAGNTLLPVECGHSFNGALSSASCAYFAVRSRGGVYWGVLADQAASSARRRFSPRIPVTSAAENPRRCSACPRFAMSGHHASPVGQVQGGCG